MEINKKELEEALKEIIPHVDSSVNYWLIRAGKGSVHYKELYAKSYVGMGWDKLKIKHILTSYTKDELKEHTAQLYDVDNPGNISNKVYSFCNEMKKGDIVVVPNSGAEKIAIGEIISDDFYIDHSEHDRKSKNDNGKAKVGILNKRRKVRWKQEIKKKYIDAKLRLKLSIPHSLYHFESETHISLINQLIYSIYTQDNIARVNFKVNTEDPIDMRDLNYFLDYFLDTVEVTGREILGVEEYNEEESPKIKINVQSPGAIAVSGTIFAVAFTAVILNGGEIKIPGFSFKLKGMLDHIKEFKNDSHDREMDRKEFELKKKKLKIEEFKLSPQKIENDDQ